MTFHALTDPDLARLYAGVTLSDDGFLSSLAECLGCEGVALLRFCPRHHQVVVITRYGEAGWGNAMNGFGQEEPDAAFFLTPRTGEGASSAVAEGTVRRQGHLLFICISRSCERSVGLLVNFALPDDAETAFNSFVSDRAQSALHLNRVVHATQLFLRLKEHALSKHALLTILNRYPCPIIAFNTQRTPIFYNAAAGYLSSQTRQFHLAPDGMRMVNREENGRLQKLLKAMIANQLLNLHQPDQLLVLDFEGLAVPALLTTNLPHNLIGFQTLSDFAIWLYLLPADRPDQFDPNQLKALFSFSRVESEMANFLFNGGNLKAFASQRTVSEFTARKQLRALLRKTRSSTQEDLLMTLFEVYLTGAAAGPRLRQNKTGGGSR